MSVFNKPAEYIKACDFEGDIKIALHHGAVNSAKTDIGYEITNEHVTTELFKGHDLALLGDIHKRQFLNEEKTIAYPGSLIQQNYSEEPSHGFLLWDVDTLQATYHQVENDYGYKIVFVENGLIRNKMKFVDNPIIDYESVLGRGLVEGTFKDLEPLLKKFKVHWKTSEAGKKGDLVFDKNGMPVLKKNQKLTQKEAETVHTIIENMKLQLPAAAKSQPFKGELKFAEGGRTGFDAGTLVAEEVSVKKNIFC